MADGEPLTGNGSIPSPAQLALAMAIVKQKPADLDIKGSPSLLYPYIKAYGDLIGDRLYLPDSLIHRNRQRTSSC